MVFTVGGRFYWSTWLHLGILRKAGAAIEHLTVLHAQVHGELAGITMNRVD